MNQRFSAIDKSLLEMRKFMFKAKIDSGSLLSAHVAVGLRRLSKALTKYQGSQYLAWDTAMWHEY